MRRLGNGERNLSPRGSAIGQAVEDAAGIGIEGERDLIGGNGVDHIEPIGAQTKRT